MKVRGILILQTPDVILTNSEAVFHLFFTEKLSKAQSKTIKSEMRQMLTANMLAAYFVLSFVP